MGFVLHLTLHTCNAEAVEAKRQRKQAVDAELGELHTRCDSASEDSGHMGLVSGPVCHL
jgi:hypothetical protein